MCLFSNKKSAASCQHLTICKIGWSVQRTVDCIVCCLGCEAKELTLALLPTDRCVSCLHCQSHMNETSQASYSTFVFTVCVACSLEDHNKPPINHIKTNKKLGSIKRNMYDETWKTTHSRNATYFLHRQMQKYYQRKLSQQHYCRSLLSSIISLLHFMYLLCYSYLSEIKRKHQQTLVKIRTKHWLGCYGGSAKN